MEEKKALMKAAVLTILLVIFMWPNAEAPAREKAQAERAKQASAPAGSVHSAEYRMGGVITHLDPAAGKISLRQQNVKRERTVTLNLDKEGAEKISAFREGDAVNVWVKGNTVAAIEKIPDPLLEEMRK